MEEIYDLDSSLVDELWTRAVAQELLRFSRATGAEVMAGRVDSEAVRVLSEIKAALDDPDLDDPECFYATTPLSARFTGPDCPPGGMRSANSAKNSPEAPLRGSSLTYQSVT